MRLHQVRGAHLLEAKLLERGLHGGRDARRAGLGIEIGLHTSVDEPRGEQRPGKSAQHVSYAINTAVRRQGGGRGAGKAPAIGRRAGRECDASSLRSTPVTTTVEQTSRPATVASARAAVRSQAMTDTTDFDFEAEALTWTMHGAPASMPPRYA
ncbi:hypothetical protein GCM10025873_28280 [Demequina sediminis]|nr:hypothetical protein GCM10025873_28280 [Demequina sediminis]